MCSIQDQDLGPSAPSAEDLERLGILRQIDPHRIADTLIRQGKAGWTWDKRKQSTVCAASLLTHYTLGQVQNLTTYDVKPVAGADLQSPMYQATLVTVLSDKVYVGKLATDAPAAKRSVAQVFLTAPEVQALFDKIPPKLSDIKSKVRLDEMERKRCKEHNASRAVRHEIEFRRADAVLAVFREIGYRIDLWDQLDELGPRSHRSGIVRAASPREKRF